jgi:DNA ligase (NAD+)
MQEHRIDAGAEIELGKAGEIIPQIITTLAGKETILPNVCSVCGAELEYDSPHLYCTGEDCIAQLIKRVSYFYSSYAMDIKTIGEARIIQLLSDPYMYKVLHERIWALLAPEHYEILDSLYVLWGGANTKRYLNALTDAQLHRDPSYFLAGLGITHLGQKQALDIYQYIKYGKARTRQLKVANQSFIDAIPIWLQANEELKGHFGFAPLPQPASFSYVITGKLTVSREDLAQWLQTHGWGIKTSVTKKVDFLILGDLPKGTSKKLTTAKKLNTRIISEYELYEILKESFNERQNPDQVNSCS